MYVCALGFALRRCGFVAGGGLATLPPAGDFSAPVRSQGERGKERGWKGVTPSEDGRRDATINPELTPSDDDEDDDEDEEESRRRRQREQVRTNCGRLTFGPGDKFDYNEREPRAAALWLARRALTLRDSTNVFWGRRKRGVRGRERERETYTPDVRRCARAL